MLQKHKHGGFAASCCSSGKAPQKVGSRMQFSIHQRSQCPRSVHSSRWKCVHKEYAKQGAAAAAAANTHEVSRQSRIPPGTRQLLAVPEDIVLECLTMMRRGELAGLQPYLPVGMLSQPGTPVLLAGVPVHEHGPLAQCAAFMDTAARRVLPGHLLRRARVLSSLQVGSTCFLRVALTACTGEETVLTWKLVLKPQQDLFPQQQQQQHIPAMEVQHGSQQDQQAFKTQLSDPQPSHTQQHAESQAHQQQQQQQQQRPPSDRHEEPLPVGQQLHQGDIPGQVKTPDSSTPDLPDQHSHCCWQVQSIAQEAFHEEEQQEQLPSNPHPRVSPELVVRAQLQALRQQQVLRACSFNLMGRHASSSGWEAHLSAFRHLLQQPQYRLLSSHVRCELGASALPSQRQFLQEVVLEGPPVNPLNSSRSSSSSYQWKGKRDSERSEGGVTGHDAEGATDASQHSGRFLWRLGMQADGCWMVRSIELL